MDEVDIIPCTKPLEATYVMHFSEDGGKSEYDAVGEVLAIAWRPLDSDTGTQEGPVRAGTSYLVKLKAFKNPPRWYHEKELLFFS
jgi:hypothetical protein